MSSFVMLLLVHILKPYGTYVLSLNLPRYCLISLPYIMDCDMKEFKPHACMHHVVILVIIVIISMLTLQLFQIVTHYTTILLPYIQVNIVYLLNSMCTLVVTCDIKEVGVYMDHFYIDNTYLTFYPLTCVHPCSLALDMHPCNSHYHQNSISQLVHYTSSPLKSLSSLTKFV